MSVRNDGRSSGNHWQPDSKDVRHSNKQQNKGHIHATGSHIERKVAEFQQEQSGRFSERTDAKNKSISADRFAILLQERAARLENK